MKRFLVSSLLSIMLISLLSSPSTALAAKIRTGDQFNLFSSTPTTFQSGAPFHFAHGWRMLLPLDRSLGQYLFQLDVDGVEVEESFLDRSYIDDSLSTGPLFLWVINFPDGLPAGIHTFTGHWSAPCQPLVDAGLYPGPCANPTEVIEAMTMSMTVEFFP